MTSTDNSTNSVQDHTEARVLADENILEHIHELARMRSEEGEFDTEAGKDHFVKWRFEFATAPGAGLAFDQISEESARRIEKYGLCEPFWWTYRCQERMLIADGELDINTEMGWFVFTALDAHSPGWSLNREAYEAAYQAQQLSTSST